MNKKIMLVFNTRERMIDYMNLLKEKYNFGNFSHFNRLHIHEYEIYFSYRGGCNCKKTPSYTMLANMKIYQR